MGDWYWINQDGEPYKIDGYPPEKNGDNEKLWRVGNDNVGDYRVSTVFLALNHQWNPNEKPVLFETMVFPKDSWGELYCKRYSTWQEAFQGHQEVVAALKAGTGPEDL